METLTLEVCSDVLSLQSFNNDDGLYFSVNILEFAAHCTGY